MIKTHLKCRATGMKVSNPEWGTSRVVECVELGGSQKEGLPIPGRYEERDTQRCSVVLSSKVSEETLADRDDLQQMDAGALFAVLLQPTATGEP